MRIELTVAGEPTGKGRPNFTKKGHTYTPEKTASYENYVRLMYSQKYKGLSFTGERPLAVVIKAYMSIPQWTIVNKVDK